MMVSPDVKGCETPQRYPSTKEDLTLTSQESPTMGGAIPRYEWKSRLEVWNRRVVEFACLLPLSGPNQSCPGNKTKIKRRRMSVRNLG